MKVNAPGHGAPLAGMAAAMILAIFTVVSAGTITHGFVSYYTASRLLVSGELGPLAYDDRWFGEVVQRLTGTTVREIFIPNPPPMALMALPLVGLSPQAARAVWLGASLAALLAGVAGLIRFQARRNRDLSVPVVLLMLLAPAVFTNLRIGQGYLFVFGLFAAAAVLLLRNRDRLAGICLGLLLVLKTSGVALALLLVVRRRWTAVRAAAITAVAIAVAITPWIDPAMWWVYPSHVQAYVARPASSVTAYQTTLGLFRHLCVADPQWNPQPAASCAPIAYAMPSLLIAAATVATMFLARRSTRPETWIASAATLSVLTLPAVAEPHFVLMAIPLALLRLPVAEFAVVAALLLVPLELTAERFTAGWWALLAYPRLYAAWLLWAASIRALRAETAGGVATRDTAPRADREAR
jgi:hypothetical protein